MRLASEHTLSRLQTCLASILHGTSLDKWVDNVSHNLLTITSQKSPPLDLQVTSPVLQARHITNVQRKPYSPWLRGQLEPETNGFVVELPPTYPALRLWSRLILAHEIAHTFLYDIRESPPLKLVHFHPGNRDLEWFCHYLGKRLLVPEPWLRQKIQGAPDINSQKFSLTILKKLEKIFLAPWQVVAERLVEDLSLWNCIILQFNYSDKFDNPSRRSLANSLRLTWHTIPPAIKGEVYLPIGRREDERMIFPRVKGCLEKVISECLFRGKQQSEFRHVIHCSAFNVSTTGNLGKFLSKTLGTLDVQVHCAVKLTQQNQLPSFPKINKRLPSVVMCIPLQPN